MYVYIDMYDDDDDEKSKFTFDDKNADQVGKRRYDSYISGPILYILN